MTFTRDDMLAKLKAKYGSELSLYDYIRLFEDEESVELDGPAAFDFYDARLAALLITPISDFVPDMAAQFWAAVDPGQL